MPIAHTHPSANCRKRHGCYCDPCVALYRAARRTEPPRAQRAGPVARQHGHPSVTCWRKHGCRCDGCGVLYRARRRIEKRPKLGPEIGGDVGPLAPDELLWLRRAVGLVGAAPGAYQPQRRPDTAGQG